MMRTWICEKWHDGSWWELQAPDTWTFERDTSVRGWPYKLRSTDGAILTIWEAKDVFWHRAAWQPPLPAEITSDAERKAYGFAEPMGSAGLVRREVGSLVGFTHALSMPHRGWEGFFISEPWMIHARFESQPPGEDTVALQILASVQFQKAA
jgi:hypothetical protein